MASFTAKKITVTYYPHNGYSQQVEYKNASVLTDDGAHFVMDRDKQVVGVWPVNGTVINVTEY